MKRRKPTRWAELIPEVGGKAADKKTAAAEEEREVVDEAELEAQAAVAEETAENTQDAVPKTAPDEDGELLADTAAAAAQPPTEGSAAEEAETTTQAAREERVRRCAAMRERAQAAAARSAGSLAGGPARFDPEGDAFRRAFKAALR